MMQPSDWSPAALAWLGVDVGGTKVRAAVETADGSILGERTVPSSSFTADFVPSMAAFITEVRNSHPHLDFSGIGIGMPGVVGSDGTITQCPAFPRLSTLDVAGAIAHEVKRPVVIANDADLSALAEHRFGNHDVRSLASLALGTGVGLGLVVDGQVLYGDKGAAGEVANYPIWNNGQLVDLESIVSVEGLLRERGWRDRARIPELITAAAAGEAAATNVVATYCSAVAQFIGGLCAIIDPGVVVLTGGLGTREIVTTTLISAVRDLGVEVELRISAFQHRAPLLGAIALRTENKALVRS